MLPPVAGGEGFVVGGPGVEGCSTVDKPVESLVFTVEDNGVGVGFVGWTSVDEFDVGMVLVETITLELLLGPSDVMSMFGKRVEATKDVKTAVSGVGGTG